MQKIYSRLLLMLLGAFIMTAAAAQEVYWAAANPYQGSNSIITTIANDGNEIANPVPANNNDLWGGYRPDIYLASDGNVYGFNSNAEGSLLYKITDDGIFPVHQFEYGSFGPMAEGNPGWFYNFSSGADGNYVVVERVSSEGAGYKQHGFYKPGFRPQRLLNVDGAIYGVSTAGGAYSGSGYLFKFTPTDDLKGFQVLYNFSTLNGRKPVGRLVEGTDDYLYGVTSAGGVNEGGVIYKIKKDGTGFTKIYDFSYTNGRYPASGLVADESGYLYGRTTNGTAGKQGALFRIKNDGSDYKIISNIPYPAESMGEMAYHNGHIYLFQRNAGDVPRILKVSVYGYYTTLYAYPSTTLFNGFSILVDPSPKQAKVYTTSPANGATVSHINTKLVFSPVTNASLYTFELSLNGDFTNPVGRGQSSKPEFIATDLKSNTKYYIRVKTNVWPTFGPVTTFTTAPIVVNNNFISNPRDGAINVSAPTTKVTAGTVTGAKRYTIELSTTPDFTNKVVRTSKVDYQRTMVFDSLKYSTKYYGRFKTDISGYGRVTSFTTRAEQFASLTSPTAASDVSPVVVELLISPSADAKRHTIQLSTSSTFATTPLEVVSAKDNQTHFVVKDLRHGTRYFVRIKSDINTTWSSTFSFRTRSAIAQRRLWGVTTSGGANNAGTVFSFGIETPGFTKHFDYDPIEWNEEASYYDYGEALQGSLIHGPDDKLYFHSSTKGSSAYGGSIFEVDRFGAVRHLDEIALHYGNMTLASNNIIYTTVNSHLGSGVIDSYELHSRVWERMHVFTRTNGVDPGSSLIELRDGFLYGRATEGGQNNGGTLYRMRYDGSGFQVMHYFSNAANGLQPTGDLVLAADGFFYGTTAMGGVYGLGTVFKIRPDGTGFAKLYDFNGINGAKPMGGVILNGTTLYGTTSIGGNNNDGTIFKISTSGSGFTRLFSFYGTNGSNPIAKLTLDNGYLYGMTTLGGSNDKGVLFKVSVAGYNYTVLHEFNPFDGFYPDGHLVIREDVSPSTFAAQMTDEPALVTVSPNPTTAQFVIETKASDTRLSDANNSDEVRITVTDMQGLIVYESTMSSTLPVQIGESFKKGIYILKAQQGKTVSVHRLVKK